MRQEPVQRVQIQACYILHHRPLRETSVVADLLTPDHGRVSVVARGARSPKSKHRSLLQPFRPLLASWSGRGELKTLTGLEECGMPVVLNSLAMGCAYYLNELLLRLVPPFEPNPEAFALYARTLTLLPAEGPIEPRLRIFELQLLELLGLVPDFGGCVDGVDPPIAGLKYLYVPETGIARLLFDADARSNDDRPLIVSGDTLLALANPDSGSIGLANPELLLEAKKIMRRQLGQHLGSAPLKSREMLAHYANRSMQQ